MTVIEQGSTILLSHPELQNPHLHIILVNPINEGVLKTAMVNISSYHGLPTQETTVILHKGEHDFIKHDSYVRYSDAKKINVDVIQKLLDERRASFRVSVTPELLYKVFNGLLRSKNTPSHVKAFCRNNR